MHRIACTEHLASAFKTLFDCRRAHTPLISDFVMGATSRKVTQSLEFDFSQAGMLQQVRGPACNMDQSHSKSLVQY